MRQKIFLKDSGRGTIKCKNIYIIGVPEGKQDVEELFEEIMVENFPNLVKELDIQPQETQQVSKKMNLKRPTLRHVIIKIPKVKYKERFLKAAREKQLVTYRGAPIRLAAEPLSGLCHWMPTTQSHAN